MDMDIQIWILIWTWYGYDVEMDVDNYGIEMDMIWVVMVYPTHQHSGETSNPMPNTLHPTTHSSHQGESYVTWCIVCCI